MKFIDLKRSLKIKIENNYLLHGNDNFLLNKAFDLIKDVLNLEPFEMNFVEYSVNEINFEDVVNSLNTLPIFSEHKLVYVKVASESKVSNVDNLIMYLKQINPSSIFVLNVFDKIKEFEKLVPLFNQVDCNKVDEKTISQFVELLLKEHDKQIASDAMKKLNEYCLYTLSLITQELQKVIAFVGTRTLIEISDIESIVTKNVEYQVFDLTESLATKNAARAFGVLGDIKMKKDNEKTLLSLISSHFRRLLHISLSKDNKAELSALLKVKEYAVTVALNQVKLFNQRQLKKINELCLQAEYEVKSGVMNFAYATDYLILQILNI